VAGVLRPLIGGFAGTLVIAPRTVVLSYVDMKAMRMRR
jgi:hypothetical protein